MEFTFNGGSFLSGQSWDSQVLQALPINNLNIWTSCSASTLYTTYICWKEHSLIIVQMSIEMDWGSS